MIADFVLGSVSLSFTKDIAYEVFSVIAKYEIPFSKSKLDESGASVRIPVYSFLKFRYLLPENVETEYHGVPKYLISYRKRWGIPAATLSFALVIFLSCSVLWRIDVIGNHNLSTDYITDVLSRVGCSVGDRISQIDIEDVNNKFLIESDGVAWISVNLNGTHANVEIRETADGANYSENKIYNIVASEDGQIERVASIEGKPVVTINDAVEKGDVLISGVINYHENLLRFESAKGSIFAKVTRKFDIEVPLECEKKVYTGEFRRDRELFFFKNRINLIKNSRIPYKFYDTIEGVSDAEIFSEILPVSVKTREFREYEMRKTVLTEKEAKKEALVSYRKKLTETVGDASLLNKTVQSSFDGKVYKIHCELYCLADIAKQSEITIKERADEIGTENSKTAVP